MELQPEQILIASGIGMAIIWILTVGWMGLLRRPKPSEGVMKTIAFVASTVLAYLWSPITLPDPAVGLYEFVSALLVSALVVFKLSQAVYDHVWRRITDGIAKRVSFLSFLSVKR